MKVLIIKLSSIGDVIHTLPALDALRKGFRKSGVKARIDWLVEEAASGILKGHPLIDDVIIVRRGWGGHLRENLKTAGFLASRRYDLVMDFQGLLKSGVWVWLSKGKKRMGFSNSRELSHLFLNEKLPAYDPEKHAVDRYLDLARAAGGIVEGVSFNIDISRSKDALKKKLEAKGVEGPFFALVTRARWATKLWSDELFIALSKRIAGQTGFTPVLAGGAGDKAALEDMRKAIGGKAVSLSGETDLLELAALFSLSSLVVTVDSGPMHLAAAAGAKVVALFGPTAPWRTGPYGKGHVIVRKGLECSPCFKKKCVDAKCMALITVDEVMEGVGKLLQERDSRH